MTRSPPPVRFWPAQRPRRRRGAKAALLLLAALLAVPLLRGGGGEADPGRWPNGNTELRARFGLCHEGGGTNCVVDGDTFWAAGAKFRVAGIDAPETHEPRCPAEAALGRRSALRLQALLNSGTLTLRAADRARDPNGRLLRHVAADGHDVGDRLVAEGLARRYGGGKRPWC
jgi:micrococcal nuclease